MSVSSVQHIFEGSAIARKPDGILHVIMPEGFFNQLLENFPDEELEPHDVSSAPSSVKYVDLLIDDKKSGYLHSECMRAINSLIPVGVNVPEFSFANDRKFLDLKTDNQVTYSHFMH